MQEVSSLPQVPFLPIEFRAGIVPSLFELIEIEIHVKPYTRAVVHLGTSPARA